MKMLTLVTLLLLTACQGCVRRWPDPQGLDAREMMVSTVKVRVKVEGTWAVANSLGVSLVPDTLEWSGTGFVVASDRSRGTGESLVMTAAHVGHVPRTIVRKDGESVVPRVFLVKSVERTVERLDGSECPAEPSFEDLDHDVSVLRTGCVAGSTADLADRLPPQGAFVSVTGCPEGFHEPGVFAVTDGRYLGTHPDGELLLSAPAAHGSSGSGVFYQGRVVGLLRAVYEFDHVTTAVDLSYLRHALRRALEAWDAR